jgi:hypothetical protein
MRLRFSGKEQDSTLPTDEFFRQFEKVSSITPGRVLPGVQELLSFFTTPNALDCQSD